ncbi:MAG: glycosyltransferase family 39 protein [Synergistaceae bacterium]|jgi:hypothetical protein|nr:glycosyltransferase family 39 protein [Synergistaceae bacterium]
MDSNRKKIKHNDSVIIVLIALFAFVELLVVAAIPGSTQFWGDEFASLWPAVQSTLNGSISVTMTYDSPGIIFNTLLWFWYHIIPYGDKYLLILPAFFAALSIWATGMAVGSRFGGRGGIVASLLMLINTGYTLLGHTTTGYISYGNELRNYTLAVFVSALLLWSYISRMKLPGRESPKQLVTFGLTMALLFYCHYVAAIMFVGLFAIDAVLFIKRKIGFRVVFAYAIAFILVLPRFLISDNNALVNKVISGQGWFDHVPDIKEIARTAFTLVGGNPLLIILFAGAVFYTFWTYFTRDKSSMEETSQRFYCLTVALSLPVLFYLVFIVYTVGILGGKSWWDMRYFLLILPWMIYVITSMLFSLSYKYSLRHRTHIVKTILIIALIAIPIQSFLCLYSCPSASKWADWQKESADYIYNQSDVRDPKVGVTFAANYALYAPYGWKFYYLEQAGQREPLNYIEMNSSFDNFIGLDGINKLYVAEGHGGEYWTADILSLQFEKIQVLEDIHVTVWERRTG